MHMLMKVVVNGIPPTPISDSVYNNYGALLIIPQSRKLCCKTLNVFIFVGLISTVTQISVRITKIGPQNFLCTL